MSDARPFRDLIRLVRAGDDSAAAELVRLYEPAIRRAVRVRLHDTRLERHFDSMDICQSVLASFFVRVAAGQYDLDEPDQLLRLLATMARNKLAKEVRRQQADCRDFRRVEAKAVYDLDVVDEDSTPTRHLANRELLELAKQALSIEERQLADLRAEGRTWQEIGDELKGDAGVLQKRLSRAVERVTKELGLGE